MQSSALSLAGQDAEGRSSQSPDEPPPEAPGAFTTMAAMGGGGASLAANAACLSTSHRSSIKQCSWRLD